MQIRRTGYQKVRFLNDSSRSHMFAINGDPGAIVAWVVWHRVLIVPSYSGTSFECERPTSQTHAQTAWVDVKNGGAAAVAVWFCKALNWHPQPATWETIICVKSDSESAQKIPLRLELQKVQDTNGYLFQRHLVRVQWKTSGLFWASLLDYFKDACCATCSVARFAE